MNRPLKFIHIPKTGGTSIEQSAYDVGINWGKYDPNLYLEKWKTLGASWHQPLYQLAEPEIYNNLLNKYDFFCVVRNPYHKIISEFYCPWNVEVLIKNVSVEYFNMFIQKKIKECPTTDHWAPQSLFVYHEGKQIIKHVLRFEFLSEEFQKLTQDYGLNIPLKYHIHKADKKYGVKDLDPVTIKLINNYYIHDFINFNYPLLQD